MAKTIVDLNSLTDIIDQLNEAKLFCEAAYLAAAGMQMRHESTAMQAVIGAASDNLKDALGKLETAQEDLRK